MKQTINTKGYFFVNAKELGPILKHLENQGYVWTNSLRDSYPIQKFYDEAVNRDYTGHRPVLHVEHYHSTSTPGKVYKEIFLTTDLLINDNIKKGMLSQPHEIASYNELKRFINMQQDLFSDEK